MRKLYAILLAGLMFGVCLTTTAKAGNSYPHNQPINYNMDFFYHHFPGFSGIKLVDLIIQFCKDHHCPCPISP